MLIITPLKILLTSFEFKTLLYSQGSNHFVFRILWEFFSQPTHPLHPIKMNSASTRGIPASAGTTLDSTYLYFSCRHYLILKKIYLLKEFYNLLPSSLFYHLPIKLWLIVEHSPLQTELPQCVPYLSFAVTIRFLLPVKDRN